MLRAAVTLAIFVVATAGSFAAMTGDALALLWSLAGFRWDVLGFAIVIYSPSLVLFFIVSTAIGLWVSHRAHYRWARPRNSR